jgi:ferredoxin
MTTFTITLANRGGVAFEVDHRKPLLQSLGEQGVDLPYGCKYGGCITCGQDDHRQSQSKDAGGVE